MIGILADIRQLGYLRGEIKHLVEIRLELVPAQVAQFILSPVPDPPACVAAGDAD